MRAAAALLLLCTVKASRFSVLLEAGSTGTRVYVYERVKAKEIAGSRSPVKTPPGLHAFVGNDSALKNYLLPLVDWAKDRVPEEEWGATPLRLYATAGMRLVGDENAAKLYDACHTILNETPFLIRRSAIKTITGEDEAFFGAVGANYAVNAIDADETPSDGAGDLVGALDLGGASTQVATALRQRVPPQLNKKHFSVATYLGYGVERFHERYIKTVDRDPCAQPADFDGCRSAIASALGIMDCRSQQKQPCALPFDSGEDEAPPEPIKPAPNARFVATSLYFYAWRTLHQALPLLVELGGDEYDTAHAKAAHAALDGMWPAPSVEKAKDAAEAYCSASPALLSKAASEEIAWDAFHGDSARRHRDFPRRCFEAAYVDVLLRDVVGVDPSGRALLVAIKLRGVELDWTLGAVLDADAHALTRRPRHQPHTHGVDGTVPVTKKHGGWRFFLLGFCGIALLLVLVARGGNEQRRSSKIAKASPRTGGHLEFPSNGWRRAAPGLVSRASYEHLSAARLV
mgnify:FL=1